VQPKIYFIASFRPFLATLAAGERPGDLTEQEAAGYDVATALINGGVLPELTYHTLLPSSAKEAWRS